MPDPYRSLASFIEERARSHTRAVLMDVQAELGTITASGLKLDGFAHEIKDYLVAEYLTLPATFGTDSAGDTLATPAPLRALQPGDRVLVVPVNGGQDHVVIARVKHA